MLSHMDTLIGVVSYNDAPSTIRTVQSLLGHGRIVVWDNGSEDGTPAALERFGDEITVHAHPRNSLWTPACNGIISNYLDSEKYILLSNNDVFYRPVSVPRLREALESHDDVGIVAPSGAGLGGLQDFASNWGQRALKGMESIPNVRTNYVVGASFMFRSKLIKEIGYLDNEMPLGADDHDYCIRAKAAGYQLMVVNSAYVAHRSHSSFKHAKPIWDEWGGKSWAVFNEKWAGYYFNELEALRCHWNPVYHPGWDYGTGWLTEVERMRIWEERGASYSDPL